MIRELKYLAAYIIPLSALFSVHASGIWTYSTMLLLFVLIPILEPLLPNSDKNIEAEVIESYNMNKVFDWLLYLNVPIIYAILYIGMHQLDNRVLSSFEIVGIVLTVGTVLGAMGINVAHELGHKREGYKKLMAKMLLLPSMYMHFIIEHNHGHHKNVATDMDPASARKGEIVYIFWVRSTLGSYLSAWEIESKRLSKLNLNLWSLRNQMIQFSIVQIAFLLLIWSLFSTTTFVCYLGIAIFSFLLLETINYIEHYGLRRKKLNNGRYERVLPEHSWNSNHELGRILLYELTRHSDHHYLAHKKYQILDHHSDAKQLPVGYPSSMLLSLFPPLWFKIMNSRV